MNDEWIELREKQELIASFGGAEILKLLDGRLEIQGGIRGRASPRKSVDGAVSGENACVLNLTGQPYFRPGLGPGAGA